MEEDTQTIDIESSARVDELSIEKARRIGVREITPVIYTGQASGGNEYHASNNPNVGENHIIDTGVPAGATIVEAWYTPYHNIRDLRNFALIDVNRHNNRQVKLSIAGYGDSNSRLRIKIHVLYYVT